MRGNPRTSGWTCRSAAAPGRTGGGAVNAPLPDRPVRPVVAGLPPRPATAPEPASGLRGGDHGEAAGAVRVRFVPSDVPVLTCRPSDRTAAVRGAIDALARLGCSYLGGTLEVTSSGPAHRAADERLAAARAVENALRGGCGSVQVPPPRSWPAPPHSPDDDGCPGATTT